MKPVRTLAATLASLMAADTAYLASATAMKLALITDPFTESLDRVIADLTLASASPLAPVAGTSGAQENGVDPVTSELKVEVKAPAGGFRWETGVGFSGPVTIYGYALTNGAVSVLLGTQALDTPITLTGDNQSHVAPQIEFRIDPSKIT